MTGRISRAAAAVLITAGLCMPLAAEAPQQGVVERIEALGGYVVRDPAGTIVEVSLARTWATDHDVAQVAGIESLKRLDLSLTYVTDRGIEQLQRLQHLEDLTLNAAEFLTDAAVAHLRANKGLRRLVLRGVDITDVGMPHIAELTNLRTLDLSHTMVGDVGLESLPSLTELEELNLGGNAITGLNLNFLKLLPKLKKLSLHGIQRRNAGACWTPLITDLDLDTIALLSGLEELDLGVGISLGMGGKPAAEGGGNCSVTGGIQLSDLGLAKLATLKKLRRLDVSGARLTPAGIEVLRTLPQLERLSVWNCPGLDDAAAKVLAGMPSLVNLDVSYTSIGDDGLALLAKLPQLKFLYLTETKVTPEAVEQFRKEKAAAFVSWARRPAPRGVASKLQAEPDAFEDDAKGAAK
jgi:Leucine-rich repeat (LRR) protein